MNPSESNPEPSGRSVSPETAELSGEPPTARPSPEQRNTATETALALSKEPESIPETAGATALPGFAPVAAAPPDSRRARRHTSLPGSFQSLMVTVVIAVFVITFIVQAFQIPSESMENTLLIGDYLLVDKVHFAHGGAWGRILPYTQIRRGDIIVFRPPMNPQQHFVKRVIGLPGDRIRMRNKQVFVNGIRLGETYVVYRSPGHDAYRDDFPRPDLLNPQVEPFWWVQMRSLVSDGELTVPPGKYFAMGDNRDESLDSRYWGFVPRENIIGRPLLIYWSMLHPDRLGQLSENPGDKLLYFAYTVSHLFQDARWKRTFQRIK